jgi:hypothetical protein
MLHENTPTHVGRQQETGVLRCWGAEVLGWLGCRRFSGNFTADLAV